MRIYTLLWVIDNLVSVIFSRTDNSSQNLPEEIKTVTEEKYYEVMSRIIDFRTKILFSVDAEIILSASDINATFKFHYDNYSSRTLKDKAFDVLYFFDVEEGEIIMYEASLFLIFGFRPLFVKKKLKFELINGEIHEFKKTINFFGSEIKSDKYVLVKNEFSTSLIYRILTSPESNSVDSCKKSTIASSRVIAEPLIKKIKLIRISDKNLILTA